MARTTASQVQGVLQDDFGLRDDGTTPDVTPYIDSANVVVTRVNTCAGDKGITLSDAELELIERWLAAHLYAVSDKPLASKSSGGASGSFHGQTGMKLEATLYGQHAMLVDYSGCLAAIGKRQNARCFWLGKNPGSQIDYEDRRLG